MTITRLEELSADNDFSFKLIYTLRLSSKDKFQRAIMAYKISTHIKDEGFYFNIIILKENKEKLSLFKEKSHRI